MSFGEFPGTLWIIVFFPQRKLAYILLTETYQTFFINLISWYVIVFHTLILWNSAELLIAFQLFTNPSTISSFNLQVQNTPLGLRYGPFTNSFCTGSRHSSSRHPDYLHSSFPTASEISIFHYYISTSISIHSLTSNKNINMYEKTIGRIPRRKNIQSKPSPQQVSRSKKYQVRSQSFGFVLT